MCQGKVDLADTWAGDLPCRRGNLSEKHLTPRAAQPWIGREEFRLAEEGLFDCSHRENPFLEADGLLEAASAQVSQEVGDVPGPGQAGECPQNLSWLIHTSSCYALTFIPSLLFPKHWLFP